MFDQGFNIATLLVLGGIAYFMFGETQEKRMKRRARTINSSIEKFCLSNCLFKLQFL